MIYLESRSPGLPAAANVGAGRLKKLSEINVANIYLSQHSRPWLAVSGEEILA